MEKCNKVFREAAIKNATKALVDRLVNKIPQWKEINYHIDIRNCLVHSDGRLDNKSKTEGKNNTDDKIEERNKRIKDYAKSEPTLKIVKRPHNKPSYDQIILEKGFCEHTLEILDKFLYSVDLISGERKQRKGTMSPVD